MRTTRVSDIHLDLMDTADLALMLGQVRSNLVLIRDLIEMGSTSAGSMLTDYLAMESLLEAEMVKRGASCDGA